jgi:serine/threonine-protein kinase
VVAGAVGLLLLGLGVRALMGGEARQATVTLVTNPPDVEVLVDGRPLVGQSSPFMAQDLTADVEHEVVVRKDGYTAQTQRFKIGEGEIKPLPTVELQRVSAGTGFSLTSTPEGVQVSIDGEALAQHTPVRVTDLKPGLHVVRLEQAGFQPWETQVELASGQVIELPAARLLPGQGGAASKPSHKSDSDDGASASKSERSSSSSSHRSSGEHRSSSSSSRSAGTTARAPQPAVAPRAAQPVAAPAAAGANMGFLRINSRPWAQVFVDGRFVGNTPLLNAPVPAGKHKIKLVNPDMKMNKVFTLQIQAGRPTTKLVELMN